MICRNQHNIGTCTTLLTTNITQVEKSPASYMAHCCLAHQSLGWPAKMVLLGLVIRSRVFRWVTFLFQFHRPLLHSLVIKMPRSVVLFNKECVGYITHVYYTSMHIKVFVTLHSMSSSYRQLIMDRFWLGNMLNLKSNVAENAKEQHILSEL